MRQIAITERRHRAPKITDNSCQRRRPETMGFEARRLRDKSEVPTFVMFPARGTHPSGTAGSTPSGAAAWLGPTFRIIVSEGNGQPPKNQSSDSLVGRRGVRQRCAHHYEHGALRVPERHSAETSESRPIGAGCASANSRFMGNPAQLVACNCQCSLADSKIVRYLGPAI